MADVLLTGWHRIATVADALLVAGGGVSTGISFSAGGGRFGGNALAFTDRRGYLSVNIPDAAQIGVRIAAKGSGGAACLLRAMDDETEQWSLWKRSDGRLEFRSDGTALGVSAARLGSAAMTVLRVTVTINGTTGSALVEMDGADEIEADPEDIQVSANAYATELRIGEGNASAGTVAFTIGDVAVRHGESAPGMGYRPIAIATVAEGSTIDFTPSTGTDNEANIDDASPDGDGTYNSSSAAADLDLFTTTPPSPTPSAIRTIAVTVWAKKDEGGSRTLATKVAMNAGVDVAVGTYRELSDTYLPYQEFFPEDPAAAAPWSDLTGLEVGYENEP